MDFFAYIIGCTLFCWIIDKTIGEPRWRTEEDTYMSLVLSMTFVVCCCIIELEVKYKRLKSEIQWIAAIRVKHCEKASPMKISRLSGTCQQLLRPPQWDVVAELPAFEEETIASVFVCDLDHLDDPLCPNKSVLHCVGMRRRDSAYYGFHLIVTIWRMSTLTRRRHRLHTFYYFYPLKFDPQRYKFVSVAFEHNGVIFVCFQHKFVGVVLLSRLFAYDYRFKVSAESNWDTPNGFNSLWWNPVAILCHGRRKGSDNTINGWRIQFLMIFEVQIYEPQTPLRNIFSNVTFDFEDSQLDAIHHEDVIFKKVRVQPLTLGRYFGCYRVNPPQRWTLVFDVLKSQYLSFQDFDEFLKSDPVLSKYRDRLPVELDFVSPMMLTERECVRMELMKRETVVDLKLSLSSRVVLRSIYQQPSLRFLAARALFKSNRWIHDVKESEFLRETGINLIGHFGS